MRRLAAAVGLFLALPAAAQALPSFRELEAQQATIGKVRVETREIFDTDHPEESAWFYRTANKLHVETRPAVIERLLLFKAGDRVSERVIEETERILRASRFLYDVQIKPTAYRDGVVDIDVLTRDTWTLEVTASLTRSGGENATSFGIADDNFLGTGARLGFLQTSDVDREGTEFEFLYGQALDGRTEVKYFQGRYDDGTRYAAAVRRPFYALDARWSAGAAWEDWDRIDPIYNAGDVVSEYRHRSEVGEVFGGWSAGLVDGWVHRYSIGLAMHDDTYAPEPGRVPPSPFPRDHAVRGPFARYEVLEDRFVRRYNRDQIARPEFFEMGFNAKLQVTRSVESWGASRSAWLYSAAVSRGFQLPWAHDLLASAKAERRFGSTGDAVSQAGILMRYFAPWSAKMASYALVSADRVSSGAAAPEQLLLGGDNGLRGYPLRYQSGERRALLTLEQRLYTDWYIFRLVRVGGAVFYDVGSAWGGVNQNAVNGGWLSDAGIGLRLSFDRASFGKVLHADIAFPLDRAAGIDSVQFLVRGVVSF